MVEVRRGVVDSSCSQQDIRNTDRQRGAIAHITLVHFSLSTDIVRLMYFTRTIETCIHISKDTQDFTFGMRTVARSERQRTATVRHQYDQNQLNSEVR